MGLVLSDLDLSDLSGSKDAHNSAVLGDALEVTGDGVFSVLGGLELVGVLGEGLLFAGQPVLVHSALDFLVEVLGPDGTEGAEATGGLDVADQSDDLHWGALNT